MTSDNSSKLSGLRSTAINALFGYSRLQRYTLRSSELSINSSLLAAEIALI
jgi:hypothetical protein